MDLMNRDRVVRIRRDIPSILFTQGHSAAASPCSESGASGKLITEKPIISQGGIMASKASAVWTGSLKEGKGTISTATGVLNKANYSFATRFADDDSGTTPEELIAAAHASCFSMALGAQLGGAGLTPEKIETHAAVTLAKTDAGFAITRIALTTTASVPGASQEAFDKAAADAKSGCPISKLFANNTEILLDAKLV
jgi:osmotically inducible protein OsmC